MADYETQEFEKLNYSRGLFRKYVEWGWGFQTVFLERDRESVIFVRIDRHIPST